LAGHDVYLADSLRFPLARATRMSRGFIPLPSARQGLHAYGHAVADTCATYGIDLILPTCEEVFFLAAARDCLGLDIPLRTVAFDRLAEVHDKYRFSRLAMGFGADPAETHFLATRESVRAFDLPGEWIFKPVWSRFGDRVLIKPNNLEALVPTSGDPWIAQRFLPGEELCVYAAAEAGRIVAMQAYRPLYRAGHGIGAGVMVAPISDPAIDRFVAGFVLSTGWTGQISFDFRRDESGEVHVLECNPRATTGAHFFQPQNGLAGALVNGHPAVATEHRSLGVPLAMLIYGLPTSLRNGGIQQWWRDFNAMAHLLETPDDRDTLPWQFMALGEAVFGALRNRQGLKAAATADIEWNGEPLL